MSERDAPQVAWKAIERNARAFSKDGVATGKVSKVVGDPTADVFTGLALSVDTLGPERFVAAERVSAIWPDRVELDLTSDEIHRLPKHEETPTVRWRPGGLGGLVRRFLGR